jgi:hypothetical protein
VLNEQELEEQRRQAEGVDALLNLAGYQTNTTLLLKRPLSNGQYYYTTEISSPSMVIQPIQTQTRIYYSPDDGNVDDEPYDEPPPSKKAKSRSLKSKLKKKSWYR